jgi:hypothetical protein
VGSVFGMIKEGLTRFIKPETPVYSDGIDNVLFPFSYSNNVLDITFEGNTFKASMVDSINQEPNAESDTAVRIISGPSLVTSLGNNFKDYVRAWRSGTIDVGSPIRVIVAPQVVRVQEASISHVTANSGQAWTISTTPPSCDNFIVGNEANKYNTSYIFKTPLTFSIVEGGVTQYITFRTMLDQE